MSLKIQDFALVACVALAILTARAATAAQKPDARRLQERLDNASRKEGEALVALVDASMAGRPVTTDFTIAWRNDFLKADPGTLVPFTITIDRGRVSAAAALLYVRVARRGGAPATDSGRGATFSKYAFDAMFPVELAAEPGQPIRITRGFAVRPGDYDVVVALRERPADPLAPDTRGLRSGLLRQSMTVPDFWIGPITTSSIMLASRIAQLPAPLGPDEVLERPYAVGSQEIVPAEGGRFRRDNELIVVFLIYNQRITLEDGFDVTVDYHVFRRGAPGAGRSEETYVTRTTPQRFNPTTMGVALDRATAQPVLAGQGILLSSFEEGDYRIGITVTDWLSRTTISRDVTFTVAGS